MRHWIAGSLFAAAMIFCTQPAESAKIPPQPVDGKIKWVYDYEAGKKLGLELKKPLFVVFRCER